jgi:hypothetical protein
MGRGRLYGYEMLGIPHCLDNRVTVGGQVVSLKRWSLSTLKKQFFCFWYSFPLEAEQTPEHSAAGRIS